MTQRKTRAQLELLADRANRLTGSPATYWRDSEDEANHWTNIGHFTIEGRNGGYALARVANMAGATNNITPVLPLGQAYTAINAFLNGIVVGLHADRAYTV
jgi:hypothetical protein